MCFTSACYRNGASAYGILITVIYVQTTGLFLSPHPFWARGTYQAITLPSFSPQIFSLGCYFLALIFLPEYFDLVLSEHWPDPLLASLGVFCTRSERELRSEHWPDRSRFPHLEGFLDKVCRTDSGSVSTTVYNEIPTEAICAPDLC